MEGQVKNDEMLGLFEKVQEVVDFQKVLKIETGYLILNAVETKKLLEKRLKDSITVKGEQFTGEVKNDVYSLYENIENLVDESVVEIWIQRKS